MVTIQNRRYILEGDNVVKRTIENGICGIWDKTDFKNHEETYDENTELNFELIISSLNL